jgi:YD repeat-containing protein
MTIKRASTIDTYDSMDRLLTRTTPFGPSRFDTRGYDANGNLTSFTDRRGMNSTFSYDALDRLATETYTDNTVTRVYDANGRLVKAADNSGSTLFAYDAAGRLTQTINPVGSVNYTIDALGRVAARQVAGRAGVSLNLTIYS